MRDNIIIKTKGDKYKKTRDENTAEKFKKFLGQELHLANAQNVRVDRAHRLGNSSNMIAKVPLQNDQNRIFSNVSQLKDTEFSISKQFPPEVEERRSFGWAAFCLFVAL